MIATVVFGFLFGLCLAIARVNKNSVIAGMSTLEDFRVAKTMAAGIGLGVILVALFVVLGWADYHTKPFLLGGILLGGLLFGVGMAILGYCPGTLPISMGQGSIDALIGALGGLLGGAVFTVTRPAIQPFLDKDLGNHYLYEYMCDYPIAYLVISLVFGVGVISLGFLLNKNDKVKNMTWLYAGAGLGVLNAVLMLNHVAGRPIGASTAFPYLADSMAGLTGNAYFKLIQVPGNWESYFLVGAFLAGLAYALIRKEFRLQLIYSHWEKYKGNSKLKRMSWAFLGGFILLYGARMAGGCTSGHILSGTMQFALSSLVFAVVVFVAFLLTGKLFYKSKKPAGE